MVLVYGTPIYEIFPPELFPADFVTPDGGLAAALDRVYFTDYAVSRRSDKLSVAVDLLFTGELTLGLFGVDGLAFVFGGDGDGTSTARLSLAVSELGVKTRLDDVFVGIRFPKDILRPVDPTEGYAQIGVHAGLELDEAFDLSIVDYDRISISPMMIGESGIVIEAQDVILDFSRDGSPHEIIAAGFDDAFVGIYIGEARVTLPEGLPSLAPEDLVLRDAAIGSGGVSGTLSANYAPVWNEAERRFEGPGGDSLFGIPFGLRTVSVSLRQNAFLESRLEGSMLLPFFDVPLDVELGLGLDGSFTARLSSTEGLLVLRKEGVLEIAVEALAFETRNGVFTTILSGQITPLFGGDELDWPAFDVRELSIDAEGNVRLEGGWLDLPSQYSLDFYGFQLDVTRLGLGKLDDGGRWIGFSGALKLSDGLAAGGSVEGLRVIWYEGQPEKTHLRLDGVGVELEIPDVIRLSGEVAFRTIEDGTQTIRRFEGSVSVELLVLGIEVDATLVCGTSEGPAGRHTFLGTYLALELPAGIPLWATGLAIYGASGLFALDMTPDRRADEPWYGMAPGEGWYKRAPVGVTDLVDKWRPEEGGIAVGAGVTIGTVADNGRAFNGRMLLVVAFPGPIVMIEGKANLLEERSELDEEPLFRALAVLDGNEDTVLIGVDASYRYPDGGELIDIGAGAEAFFDAHDPSRWHLYLGKDEPRERRIRASVLSLFEANAYLMLDARRLAMGAWIGFHENWKFGPVRIVVEAWIDGNAALSFVPPQLHGDLWLHGAVEISVFGIGLGIGLDAMLAADVFDPWHLVAALTVTIKPPWPIPDFDVDVQLEWGPEVRWPRLPSPLEEVAVEHLKVSDAWPLRGSNLEPDYRAHDGFLDEGVQAPADLPAPRTAPVVPLDARPHLTFSRPVHDDAAVGVNGLPPQPARERLGDPDTGEGPVEVRYGLQAVHLDRWVDDRWQPMASSPEERGVPTLFGSWAPIPASAHDGVSTAQTKLWLWSKNPFDYLRRTSTHWEEWFTEQYASYPCVPVPEPTETCYGFDHLEPKVPLPGSYHAHPADPELALTWRELAGVNQSNPVHGFTTNICFRGSILPTDGSHTQANLVYLAIPTPNAGVKLVMTVQEPAEVAAADASGRAVAAGTARPGETTVQLDGDDVAFVLIRPSALTCLYAICILEGLSKAERAHRSEMANHLRDETERWSHEGFVLQPYSTYRLRVHTDLHATGDGPLSGETKHLHQLHHAYFRTEGPPGLTELSPPDQAMTSPERVGPLADLGPYVSRTIPASGPATLTRPVYRAYDQGVEFDEDYVELMYRMSGKDLSLRVFDANGRPARDARGALAASPFGWARSDGSAHHQIDQSWLDIIERVDCAGIDVDSIPLPGVLNVPNVTLAADAVHEARLIPALLHRSWTDEEVGEVLRGPYGRLGGWQTIDHGSAAGPSRWRVTDDPDGRFIEERSGIRSDTEPRFARQAGSLLVRVSDRHEPTDVPPGQWSDYRVAAVVRAPSGGAFGLVVRYQGPGDYYRFSISQRGRYARLVRFVNGRPRLLAETSFGYERDTDYRVALEAVGDHLVALVDGNVILEVVDPALSTGSIGLYAHDARSVRFAAVQVEDLAPGRSVHGFAFTTSRFANFRHHLHSFDDASWTADVVDPAVARAAAVPQDRDPTPAEADAASAFAAAVLGPEADQWPRSLELVGVPSEAGGLPSAFLLNSPEPLDPRRVAFELSRTPHASDMGAYPPSTLKMIGAELGQHRPDDESVDVLVRSGTDVDGVAIQRATLPRALDERDTLVYVDERFESPVGLLYAEQFGSEAMEGYVIVDRGSQAGRSRWESTPDAIVQHADTWGGDIAATSAEKPGTQALLAHGNWADVRVEATLRSLDDDAIGLLVRAAGDGRGYRFSMDAQRRYRRLVRIDEHGVQTLWEDLTVGHVPNTPHRVRVDIVGGTIAVWLDTVLLCVVDDPAPLEAGSVGLYCWANRGARFEQLQVTSLEATSLLWQPNDGALRTLRSAGEVDGIPSWDVDEGELRQVARLGPGSTWRWGGDLAWTDVRICTRLTTGDGATGLLFRYLDDANHYGVWFDVAQTFVRVYVRVDGQDTVLWQRRRGLAPDKPMDVTVVAVGHRISVHLDGSELCSITDRTHTHGAVGLQVRHSASAVFSRFAVFDERRRVGSLLIHDEAGLIGPSAWEVIHRGLTQTAALVDDGRRDAPAAIAVHERPFRTARISARLRSDDGAIIGLVFRYRGPDDHYRLVLDDTSGRRTLERRRDGTVDTLWSDGEPTPPGVGQHMLIDTLGDRLIGYLNGQRMFHLRDDTHRSGRVGFLCRSSAGRFGHLRVSAPPLEAWATFASGFEASDLTGWDIVDQGTLGGPSDWAFEEGLLRQRAPIRRGRAGNPSELGTMAIAPTRVGDGFVRARLSSKSGGPIGVIFRLKDEQNYYRFSMSDGPRHQRLSRCEDGTFHTLWERSRGYDTERPYEIIVDLHGSSIRIWLDGVLCLELTDDTLESGAIGLYCARNEGAAFERCEAYRREVGSRWELTDTFSNPVRGRWTFIDQGLTDAPSDWRISGGSLVQRSSISDERRSPREPRGTVAVAGPSNWDDVRLIARISGGADGVMGTVVRWAEDGSHYRFVLDHGRRQRRLSRQGGDGRVTVLWRGRGAYVPDQPIIVTMDAFGGRLRVFVDGHPVCDVDDPDPLGAGRVGLHCTNNPVFASTAVRVGSTRWVTHYRFGEEGPVDEGRVYRITSGVASPQSDGALVRVRSAAGPTSCALGRDEILRLLGPDGSVLHRDRYSLQEETTVPIEVLRSADHTTWVILTSDGTPFDAGSFRLRATYQRRVTGSPTLTEAGSDTPELAVLRWSIQPTET